MVLEDHLKHDLSLFLQEGGGSSLDQLFIIYVVIIGLRREGAKPNLQVVTKYAVFFFEGAPNQRFNWILFCTRLNASR